MNYSDSERVSEILNKTGFTQTENLEEADLLIVNTCSVRQKSEDKAFGFILNQKKESPQKIIAVTGCMVRQSGISGESKDKLLQHDVIDFVFRIEDVYKIPKILEKFFDDIEIINYCEDNYLEILPSPKNKVQVMVPIMTGCDKFCTYCIVPHTRGREVSRTIEEIYKECEHHVQNGAKEITLLGQNVNSYTDGERSNGEKCFPKLLQEIDKLHKQGLSRIRFTSPHPQDFCDELIDVWTNMQASTPYIHLPAQHGSDNVLKKMQRNYTVADYEKIIAKMRDKIPNCAISTDIIVGFPGETAEDFKQLCELAHRVKFDFSYTAIYSPRKGTPAAEMKEELINKEIKHQRFAEFDDIINKHAFAHRAEFVGKTLEILVEKAKPLPNGTFSNTGRSREFFEVWFASDKDLTGQEVEVEITAQRNYILQGKLQ